MTVFDQFNGYGFIHHRALNSRRDFEEALELTAAHPARAHIFEGDLCWDFSAGNEMFYFRHPRLIVDTLSSAQIRAGIGQGSLLGLADLSTIRRSAFIVLELKVGRGDVRAALGKLVRHMEDHFAGRYWIDGFSLSLLEYVKSLNSDLPVTLHTELVCRQHVLVAAPEWPAVQLKRLSSLQTLDGIAIRRRGSNNFMARACRDVHDANKVLIVSRIHTLDEFESSKRWGAKAGYIHGDFPALVRRNDEVDARAEFARADGYGH
ncbi:MAG: hypothetical protein HC868_05015 [Sphingomonadales bacterium]|nr:hypothetical protein [Sphingomonadales bacterium]